MASECLGLALVIANDYRDPVLSKGRQPLPGTLKDSNDYIETFVEYLKYKVVVRYNLKGNGICHAIDDLISEARDCPFGRADACIAFVFCGHGDEGVIIGQDGVKVSLEVIFNRFTSSAENEHLARLVKLFFIDACRGVNEDRGVWTPRGGEIALEKLVPTEGNMLIAYSTLPWYKAYEFKYKGKPQGLFSCILNEELRKDANIEESLENIITIVTMRMEEESKKYGRNVRFQTPQKVATLRRMLKPLKEAREFQPQPVPAPRRNRVTPIQCGAPSLPGGELFPSTLHRPGAVSGGEGVLTAGGQIPQQQILLEDSMHVTQQLQPMAHHSHISGSPGSSIATQHREQVWMEPALSHLGSAPFGGAALQTISVMARSGTTPTSLPHDYQELPQYDRPSTSQIGPLPPHTNYQGHPQSTGTPPTNTSYQGQPQLGKPPKTQLKELCEQNRWPSPQYNTPPSGNGFRSTVLVPGLGAVTGSEQPSKKKAEQDAAEKALLKL